MEKKFSLVNVLLRFLSLGWMLFASIVWLGFDQFERAVIALLMALWCLQMSR